MAKTDSAKQGNKSVREAGGTAQEPLQSGKGGGEPEGHSGVQRPDRPSVGASRTGSNPGFTEGETKDVELSSGGGLAARDGQELTEEDPDHSLRGEDQLSDGDASLEPSPGDTEPGVGGGAAGMLHDEEE